MKIRATITWTDETAAPRFSVDVDGEDYGPFRDLPNALTGLGFAIMEKIEPTDLIEKKLAALRQAEL